MATRANGVEPGLARATYSLAVLAVLALGLLFGPFASDLAAGGVNSWTPIGPSGPFSILAFGHQHFGRAYGSDGSGLYRSSDNGLSWQVLPAAPAGRLTVDSTDDDVLYVDSYNYNIYRSSDGGLTWQTMAFLRSSSTYQVSPDPWNPSRVYVVKYGGPDSPNVVYKSTNAGASFSVVFTGDVDKLIVDSGVPDRVYAAGSRLYVSTDGGTSWTSSESGLPASHYVNQLLQDESISNRLLAWLYDGIYESLDRGSSWTRLSGLQPTSYSNTLRQDPSSPSIFYFQRFDYGDMQNGLYKSVDSGRNWTLVNATVNTRVAGPRSSLIDPFDNSIWLSDARAMWVSSDGGATFSERDAGMNSVSVDWSNSQPLARNPLNPKEVFLVTYGRSYKSVDDGASWRVIPFLENHAATGVTFDPNNPQKVFVTIGDYNDGGGAYVTEDGGSTWSHTGYSNYGWQTLAVSPANSDLVLAGGNANGIQRSTDGGRTWATVYYDSYTEPFKIVFSPADPSVAYAAIGYTYGRPGLVKSTDGGASWSELSPGSLRDGVEDLVIDPDDANTLYAMHTSASGGVYKSTDGGATWSKLSVPPGFLTADQRAVYSGQYKSTDKGSSWTRMSNVPSANRPVLDPADPGTVWLMSPGVWSYTSGPNRPPVASPATVATVQGANLVIDLSAADVDKDGLSYSIVVGPSHGRLSSVSGNQVTYVPFSSYTGPDSFAFKANDGAADSNIATVSITVNATGVSGHIVGTVADGDTAAPLPGVGVRGFELQNGSWVYAGETSSDSQGSYDFPVRSTGVYRLISSDPSGAYSDEWYQGVSDFSIASDIAGSADGTISGIDFVPLRAGHVSGTVTDGATGKPVGNIQVTANRVGGNGFGRSDWRSAVTDQQGRYDIGGLSSGDYLVSFYDEDPTGRYLSEYYAGQLYWSGQVGATQVAVTAGDTRTGIDAALSPAGRITGTVRDRSSGQPLAHVGVVDFFLSGSRPDDSASWNLVFSTYTDSQGHYDLGRLPTGTHHVMYNSAANGADWNSSLETEYYSGKTAPSNLGVHGALGGTDVGVTAGATTAGVDEALAPVGFSAPITSITRSPLNPDGDNGWFKTAPVVTLSRNVPGTTFWQMDGTAPGAWNTYLAPITVPEGDHRLYYYSTDLTGNAEAVKECPGAKVDITPPSAVTVSGSAQSAGSIGLSWTSSTDSVSGVARYLVYRADTNAQVANVTGTSASIPGLAENTSYRYYVKAVDGAGNMSAASNTVTVTTPIDSSQDGNGSVGTGDGVIVTAGSADVRFDHVASPGSVTVHPTSNTHEAPANFRVLRGAYYDISTTAGFAGSVTITIRYDPSEIAGGNESNLKLFHWKNNGWQDITTSVDTVNHTVTGVTDSFSPFALFWPMSSDGTSTPASSSWSLTLLALVAAGIMWRQRPRERRA